MPSVRTSSVWVVEDSSMVMTPSLPTLPKASARSSPTSSLWAEMAATLATWVPSTGRAFSSRRAAMASTETSMPRLIWPGAAPAATLRRPSLTSAWARTVAVVVPSPATSLVLVATSLASWAPRFSYGSSSSTSRAMVTPSFVMVGAPHFLSRTTLRPRGPSVTLTVFASLSMPASRDRRAASLNASCFAMVLSFQRQKPRAAGQREHGRQHGDPEELLDDDCQDVAGGQHEVLGAAGLDFGSAVLGVDDDVANGYVNGNAVAIFEAA